MLDLSIDATPTQAPPIGGDPYDIFSSSGTSGSVMNAGPQEPERTKSLNNQQLSLLEQLQLGYGRGHVEFPKDETIKAQEPKKEKETDFFSSLANR